MKDLIEAYNSMYQLDEISFTNVGGIGGQTMNFKAPAAKKDDKPTTTPTPTTTPEAKPAAQPSAMDQWRAANPKLAAAADEKARIRGTNQTDNPLIDAEMRARMPAPTKNQDPNFQSTMKSGQYGDQGHQSLTQNKYVTKIAEPTTSTAKPAPASPPAMTAAANQAISSLEQSARAKKAQEPLNMNKWFTKPPQTQMNSYDYGNIDPDQLTSLLDAYNQVYQEQVKVPADASDAEALKGLIPKGDKVHEVKRKKLDAHFEPEGEQIEEAGDDPCWKGYTQVGMKKKGGREVPNCVPSKGVPKAKGYKKEEAEIEESAVANLIRLGLAAGTAAAGAKLAKKATEVRDTINKKQKEKEEIIRKTLGNSYEAEGEQIDEFSLPGTGMVMAPKTDPKSGVTSPMMQRKVLGMNVGSPELVKTAVPSEYGPMRQYTQQQVNRYNAASNRPSTIRPDQYSGLQQSVARPAQSKPTPTPTPATVTRTPKKPTGLDALRARMSGGGASSLMMQSYEPEGELVEAYDLLLGYLMEEGFAANVENAEKIMMVMSDEWMQSVLEQDLTARQKYLMGKVDKMNAAKAGSAHTYTSGKQNPGAALDRANRSAAQMKGV